MMLAFAKAAALGAAALLLGAAAPVETPKTPGATFRDCPQCPDMVVLPAGKFLMGSPKSEKYRGAEAQHPVTIRKPFAVGKYEVTFDQWDACVKGGGCGGYSPPDEGWGRKRQPVIHMNYPDAKAYVAWLSKTTGRRYRLLSEAEWEYAARGGSGAAFAFGDRITATRANFDASSSTSINPKGAHRARTVRVGSFAPNRFGLHDLHGNVWEWTEDCWHDDYTGAPADGSPWSMRGCQGRVLRGGSWEDYAGDIRSAARVGSFEDDRSYSDGLRVARDLP